MGGRGPQAQGGSENEKKRNDFFFPESKEDKENSEQA